jgi:DNA polymerase-3 subunit epsilon
MPNPFIEVNLTGIKIGENYFANERVNKGKSLLESFDNYVAIDLETTGLDSHYDSIIEIAAIKVTNNEINDTFQTFVNPHQKLDSIITDLTGITDSMLIDAPELLNVIPQLLEFIGDACILGHNVNFDVNFIYDACLQLAPPISFSNNFVDTLRLSRRMFPSERHNRLSDLIERFGISVNKEHRALDDAIAAKQCYDYMKQYAKANNIAFESLYPQAFKASSITTSNESFDQSTYVYGKQFVFTGTLDHLLRKDAMQIVVDMGGSCSNSINKHTNYLVLGSKGYADCLHIKDNKSTKYLKAELYKSKGLDIDIISEDVFMQMITQ